MFDGTILITGGAGFIGSHTCVELLDAGYEPFEQASGRPVPYEMVARRPGDIGICYANPSAAERIIGWRAQYGIERMCEDHWRWQSNNPDGFTSLSQRVRMAAA
jgi:UDP-glucose 4-epimerase